MTGALSTRGDAAERSGGGRLGVLLVGAFMPTLDFFVVNVAVPSIRTDLHTSDGDIQLIVALYAVSYAALLVFGGRLGDRLGHRRVFVLGLAAFTLASALCGVAPTVWVLIVARALQGMAAALLFPQVLALIQVIYQGPARAWAMVRYGIVLGSAMVAGQLLGGSLISLDLFGWSWRWVFLINIPIGLGALPAALRALPAGPTRGVRMDWLGVPFCAAVLTFLVFPLTVGRSAGWPVWSFVLLVLAVLLFPAFAGWEMRLERRGASPLLPPSLLRAGALRRGLLTVFAFYAGLASFLYVLAILLQTGRGLSPIESGLVSCPLAIGFLVASLLGRGWVARWGTRPLLVAMAVQVVGYLAQALLVSGDPGRLRLAPFMVLLTLNGLVTGLVMAPLLGMVLADVGADRAGAASGLLATAQQVAGAIGVTVIGLLFYAGPASATGPAAISHDYVRGLWFLVATSSVTLGGLFALSRHSSVNPLVRKE